MRGARGSPRARLARAALAVMGLAAGLLICEALVRVVVEPGDFLEPELLPDTVLRWRVAGGTAGHDEWGYRNREVPDRADILAIGDSQTYGHSARAMESWPRWLGRDTGQSVYTLALGGYGPIDYRALAAGPSLDLEPHWMLVGIYLGNDLMDAWRSVYTLDHWASLRLPPTSDGDSDAERDRALAPPPRSSPKPRARLSAIRTWLNHHSVLYRMAGVAVADPLLMRLQQIGTAGVPGHWVLEDPEFGVLTTLAPGSRLVGMDLADARVREGLRLTLESLDEIAAICAEREIVPVIALIPTKISVYADRATGLAGGSPAVREQISRLVAAEATARDAITAHLDARAVPWVDTLPALREGLDRERLYPRREGGHPLAAGYRVIAEAVERRMAALPAR